MLQFYRNRCPAHLWGENITGQDVIAQPLPSSPFTCKARPSDTELTEAKLSIEKVNIWEKACLGCSQDLLVRTIMSRQLAGAKKLLLLALGNLKMNISSFSLPWPGSNCRVQDSGKLFLKTHHIGIFFPNQCVSNLGAIKQYRLPTKRTKKFWTCAWGWEIHVIGTCPMSVSRWQGVTGHMQLSFTEPPGTWPLTAQDVHAPQLELNEHMAGKICSQEKKRKKTNITGKWYKLHRVVRESVDTAMPTWGWRAGSCPHRGPPQGRMLRVRSSDHSWLLTATENPAVLSLLTTVSLTRI